MENKNFKTEKYISYVMLVLLVLALIPVIYLGRYNHPTGDDYYYGVTARLIWDKTGNIGAVLEAAIKGVIHEYVRWQGTYSAMFFMYLPPNAFGDWAYKMFTGLIIISLTGGIFYCLKPILCDWMRGSKYFWITTSAILSMLCIQNVPSQGETFFWYNGSMYYTGYFAVMLFMLGLFMRWLATGGRRKFVLLLFLSIFLAGGNYVSLLPCLLILVTVTVLLTYKKERKVWAVAIFTVAMLVGLIVSALAPGNQVRQADVGGIPAWKAIIKSLLQGVRYFCAWTDIWWVTVALAITPSLWKRYKRIEFSFPVPMIVIGYIYSIFCSMSCPTFYAMNSTGPARSVAIVYYGYVLTSFLCYGYLLGYIHRKWREKQICADGWSVGWRSRIISVCIIILLGIQFLNGAYAMTTTGKAVALLYSGEAEAYEQEYQDRLKLLKDDSIKDVVFTPFLHQPDMLYVGDMSQDSSNAVNISIAQIYNKNTVRVEY